MVTYNPTPFPESVIQKSDILSITVNSLNPESAVISSTPNSRVVVPQWCSRRTPSVTFIMMPEEAWHHVPHRIGNIKAEGLTKNKLKEQYRENLSLISGF